MKLILNFYKYFDKNYAKSLAETSFSLINGLKFPLALQKWLPETNIQAAINLDLYNYLISE